MDTSLDFKCSTISDFIGLNDLTLNLDGAYTTFFKLWDFPAKLSITNTLDTLKISVSVQPTFNYYSCKNCLSVEKEIPKEDITYNLFCSYLNACLKELINSPLFFKESSFVITLDNWILEQGFSLINTNHYEKEVGIVCMCLYLHPDRDVIKWGIDFSCYNPFQDTFIAEFTYDLFHFTELKTKEDFILKVIKPLTKRGEERSTQLKKCL
jgi:hypothetical protein